MLFIPPAGEAARPPPARPGDSGPLPRPYKLMPPGCHFPSLPGAEGARLHPPVSPRGPPGMCGNEQGCHPFFRHNHPSASGDLRASSLAPSPARLRVCSPLFRPVRATRAPSPASQQAHATGQPISKPARRGVRPAPPARLTARGHPGRCGWKHGWPPFPGTTIPPPPAISVGPSIESLHRFRPPASLLAPPSHLARAILAPSPASLQAHATRLPFTKPARR